MRLDRAMTGMCLVVAIRDAPAHAHVASESEAGALLIVPSLLLI